MSVLAAIEKRAELAIGVLVGVIALISVSIASRALAPAFDELPRLLGVDGADRVVREIAGSGFGALTVPKLRALSPDADAPPALGLLLAAWARLSVGRLGILDPLICARLPWLIAAAISPLLLYAVVRPSRGRFAAALAAALLLFQPRWLHAAGIATEACALSGLWLLAIALHLRAEAGPGAPRRRLCWAAGAALAIGAAAALALATLWLVALLLAHHWAAHWGGVRRLVRRGRLPAPASLILAAPLAPLVFFACRPELLNENVIATLRALLTGLAPNVQDSLFLGRNVGGASPPVLAYAAVSLIWTLPTTLLIAAVVGFGVIGQRALARRFASGRLRPARDRHALGALVVLGACFTLVAPACVPAPLLVFPPRLELSLPFLAIGAALGVEAAARLAAGPRRAFAPAALIVFSLAWLSLRDRATLAAAYAPLLGGAQGVSSRRVFTLGDGSELGVMARRLDALGSPALAIDAPDVPEGFWQALQRHGRIKTAVTRAPGAAVRLERGASSGRARVVVERDGAALWSRVE